MVNWLSAQPYLYCGFCTLLTLLLHLQYHSTSYPSSLLRLTTVALCASAMLSKAVAVCLPLVLILLRTLYGPYSSPPDHSSGNAGQRQQFSNCDLPASSLSSLASFLLLAWGLQRLGGAIPVSAVVGLRSLGVLTSWAITPITTKQGRSPSQSKYIDRNLVRRRLWVLLESISHHEASLLVSVLVVSRAMEGTRRDENVEHRPPMPYLTFKDLPTPHRLAKACASLCWYLRQTLVPMGITHQYLLRQPFRLVDPPIMLAVLLVVGFSLCIAYVALAKPKSAKMGHRFQDRVYPTFVAWCSFILLVLPALDLVPHGPAFWAGDRYR